MKYLLAVGACYLDTILDVDHYPAEDEKLRASSIVRRRGGNCPNTLEVLQQLLDLNQNANPVSLALCAVLPLKSSSGYQEIEASFAPVTDLTHCICREDNSEPASSYIIRSRAADSRTIINYNALREMSLEEFASVADELGEAMGCCHFEVRSCPPILCRDSKQVAVLSFRDVYRMLLEGASSTFVTVTPMS
ncbi:MAG: hypothetical protein Q9197_003893 [Variospora fuerteventurae]